MIKKNKFSILIALIILYLSLASSHTFDKVPLINIPNIDKAIHFGMYFCLMSVIIIENRRNLKSTTNLFFTGLIPLSYGILMEFLQSTLTATRSGSIYDALADAIGVLVSILLWIWIKPFRKEKIR